MPRSRSALRGIVRSRTAWLASAAALLAGVAVAACTPPLPPDVLAARAEANIACQGGDVAAAVPEDFAGAMTAVGGALTTVCPDQTVTEVAVGEKAPLQVVEHAPSAEELAEFTADVCPTGSVVVVPAFAYAVGVAFNIVGLEGLVLTPEAIAGILSGSVTSWEDPLITEANAGYDLSGLPDISVLSTSHSSGSMEAMTAWLSKEVPDAWTAGTVGTISTGTPFDTSMDLLGELTAMEGTVAILPVVEAVNNSIPVASLPAGDVIVASDDTQLMKVGAGAATLTTDEAGNILASPAIGGVPVEENFDAAAAKIVLAADQPMVGWPVMGYAHIIVCNDPADPLPLSTAQYVVRLAGQGSLEAYGVTPLPEPIRVRTFDPLKVTESLASASAISTDSDGAGDTGTETPADAASDTPSDAASS